MRTNLVIAALTCCFSANAAHAQYYGPSANDIHRVEAYGDIERQTYLARRGYEYGGYGYVTPGYGAPLLPWWYRPNRVKEKTARRGGVWMQDCGDVIGVVYAGPSCLQQSMPSNVRAPSQTLVGSAPSQGQSTMIIYSEPVRGGTMITYADGRNKFFPDANAGLAQSGVNCGPGGLNTPRDRVDLKDEADECRRTGGTSTQTTRVAQATSARRTPASRSASLPAVQSTESRVSQFSGGTTLGEMPPLRSIDDYKAE